MARRPGPEAVIPAISRRLRSSLCREQPAGPRQTPDTHLMDFVRIFVQKAQKRNMQYFSTRNLSSPGTIAGVPEVVPGVNVKETIQTVTPFAARVSHRSIARQRDDRWGLCSRGLSQQSQQRRGSDPPHHRPPSTLGTTLASAWAGAKSSAQGSTMK
jgi:hypothetical protein